MLLPKYTKRLLGSLAAGVLVGMLLFAWNPSLGVFAILMLLNMAAVGLFATVSAIQSMWFKEPSQWIGLSYLILELGGVIWAIVDM